MAASSLSVGAVIGSAAVAFAATNIDDFALLTVYFARSRSGSIKKEREAFVRDANVMTTLHVVAGQTIGFTVLLGLSLLGILLGLFLPGRWVALIGFIPLLLGVKMAWDNYQEWKEEQGKDTSARANVIGSDFTESGESASRGSSPPPVDESSVTVQAGEEHALVPVQSQEPDAETALAPIGVETNNDKDDNIAVEGDVGDDVDKSPLAQCVKALLKQSVSPFSLEIVLITVANGSDNLPLFAGYAANPVDIVISVATFYVLLLVWFIASYAVVGNTFVEGCLERYAPFFEPPLISGVGIYILCGSVIVPGN